MKKLKVVWVCCFSNPEIRSRLQQSVSVFERIERLVLRKKVYNVSTQGDFGAWNTRGIDEFRHFKDVELHVISAASHLSTTAQMFESEGVHYYFYRDDDEFLCNRIKKTLNKDYQYIHTKANKFINHTIDKIHPDVIHLIGAENMYSTFVLSRPKDIPIIVHLQTLLCEPGFRKGYPLMSDSSYAFRADMEKRVIQRCEYIGTEAETFKNYILKEVKPDASFFYMDLATGLSIHTEKSDKEYDFVYFAGGIKKACDLAIEAFAIATQKYPNLKLDVIGGYEPDFKQQIDCRIKELGITGKVIFEGSFPSHEDVVKQVLKSRFALLPFKVDYNPTTIPEAMSLGLPVVSTKTDGVKILYKEDSNILLSDIGDHKGLAYNMIRLLESEQLADEIRKNAYNHIKQDDNHYRMNHWKELYWSIVNNQDN